jgi:hypothetical protein
MVDLVDEVGQLSLAQDTVRAALTAQAADIAAGAVTGFDGWYDMDAITSWAARLVRALEAIHRNLARSTDAYLARVSSRATGRLVRPVGAVDITGLRRDVTHAGAYARAADVYRYQQSLWDRVATRLDKPPTLVSPTEAAVGRVRAVADLDAQLVVRDQSRQFMTSQPAVTGWRRVFYPELSSGGSCGLCVTNATDVHRKTDVLPVHAHCSCVPVPVFDGHDPGAALNARHGAGLERAAAAVSQHGELGPVLHPADRPLPPRRHGIQKPAHTPAEKRRRLKQVYADQAAALPKVQALAAQDPAWRDYETTLTARVEDLRAQVTRAPLSP